MVAFALADTLVKVTSTSASPAQVLFYLIGGALIIFTVIAKVQGESLRDARALSPILLLRYLTEIIGMVGMVLALTYVPLSTVGAITQATPILVAVGAVIFLGEKISWRRWSSIAVGFLGVMLIVQPGTEGFDTAVLWAVLAMLSMSVRDLTTRLTPVGMPTSCLATYTMLAATPFTIGWILFNGEAFFPPGLNLWLTLLMVGLGALGYLLLIASIRTAEISVVTPFRYSRIIILLVLGVVIFDETPSFLMLVGATMIILSGIYIVLRERRVKHLQEMTKAS